MLEKYSSPEEEMEEKETIIKVGLRKRFQDEHDRVLKLRHQGYTAKDAPKPEIDPVTDDEYKAEAAPLAEYIDKAVLPRADKLPRYLEGIYRPGSKLCLVALPFNESCYGKDNMGSENWEQFINMDAYLKYLEVEEEHKDDIDTQPDESDSNLTNGFGSLPGYFFDHLPETIKKDVSEGGCTFDLEYPAEPGNYENKIWLENQVRKAYENLKNFLKKPLGMEKTDLS